MTGALVLTYREIATRLGESLSIIKTRLRVGLFKLYEQLGNDAEDVGELNTYEKSSSRHWLPNYGTILALMFTIRILIPR